MVRSPFPIRGNIVRLSYNPDASSDAASNFYDLMGREGSAVSQADCGFRTNVHQVHDVYYWRGAVLTHGVNREGYSIEIQKDGTQQTLNDLIATLESEMEVKFRKRTVSKS